MKQKVYQVFFCLIKNIPAIQLKINKIAIIIGYHPSVIKNDKLVLFGSAASHFVSKGNKFKDILSDYLKYL